MPAPTAHTGTARDLEVVSHALQRVAEELGTLVDHEIALSDLRADRLTQRPAGSGSVHVSFRQRYRMGALTHGCLLLPLAAAQSLAGHFLMMPASDVAERRVRTELDPLAKDALIELSGFVASALQESLLEDFGVRAEVRTGGCQGVREGVRPAFPYEEGTPLLVGRAVARFGATAPFEVTLMLPELPGVFEPELALN